MKNFMSKVDKGLKTTLKNMYFYLFSSYKYMINIIKFTQDKTMFLILCRSFRRVIFKEENISHKEYTHNNDKVPH